MITVTFPRGGQIEVEEGTPVRTVIEDDGKILAASVDFLTVDLGYRLLRDCSVLPLTYDYKEGREVYRRTLSFILAAAVSRVCPGHLLKIGHSLAGGYYYDLEGIEEVSPKLLSKIEEEMKKLIQAARPIQKHFVSAARAMEIFSERGREDKVLLLKRNLRHDIGVYELDGFFDIPIGPLAPDTGRTPFFRLVPYNLGFVLRFPDKKDITKMTAPSEQTRLFAVYHESKKWSSILGISTVGDINEVIAEGNFAECVQVAEGLHEKRIAAIADQIVESHRRGAPLVFIAGPSSSGKTTFAKRLSVQLRVNGLRPLALGLDDYFVDREKTPRDERGEFDFESLYALDIERFNDDLLALLDGRTVTPPRFDFKSGLSVPGERSLRLEKDQVLIVEGIHGLNDALTPRIPGERKFKIYVSALTQLTIDFHNRIPTTDTRMIRRIVRDRKFRGYSAAETIRRWPSVIRGESRNIFPFQESADVIFNTALLYELAVLRPYARRALEEVPPDQPEFAEARRILEFIQLFLEGDERVVPPTSLLREFIGGSSFKY